MADTQEAMVDEILAKVDQLSIKSLVDLVSKFEDKYGVSAAAVAVAGPAVAGGEAAVVEEKTEFDVVMKSFGSNKIEVIKTIRAITSLGLKEAKDMVEGVPSTVKEGVSKEEANDIKKKLEEAGASVDVK